MNTVSVRYHFLAFIHLVFFSESTSIVRASINFQQLETCIMDIKMASDIGDMGEIIVIFDEKLFFQFFRFQVTNTMFAQNVCHFNEF